MERLFHIARTADWEQAQSDGAYRASSLGMHLDEAGFIHLSFAHQVKSVADVIYHGMTDLVLLELDPDRLDAPGHRRVTVPPPVRRDPTGGG